MRDDGYNKAVWRCSGCGEIRQWGHDKPGTSYEPLLNCTSCGKQTRHRFVRLTDTTFGEVLAKAEALKTMSQGA
jgi:NAD-dependent SIR2 family protein deacetylase